MQITITVDSSEETIELMKKIDSYTKEEISTIFLIGMETFERIKKMHIEKQWNIDIDANKLNKRKRQTVEDLFASLLHKRDEVLCNDQKKENETIQELQETVKMYEIQNMKLQDEIKHQEIVSNLLLQKK